MAIAAVDPPPVPAVLEVAPDERAVRDPRDRVDLVPADFSEEVALTSPIPLPRAASCEAGAPRVPEPRRDAGHRGAASVS